jgi:hypothetical protein
MIIVSRACRHSASVKPGIVTVVALNVSPVMVPVKIATVSIHVLMG